LYQPGGQSYSQTYLSTGTDQTYGDLRSRSYFEFNDNNSRSPALNRLEMQFSGWKLFGGKWDASLGDFSLVPLSSSQGAVPMRGVRLISGWGRMITAETYAGQASDRYRQTNFPTFRNNGATVAQGLRAALSKQVNLRTRLSYRREKTEENHYNNLQAGELVDWSNRLEWEIARGVKSRHFVNISRSRDFSGEKQTGISGGSQYDLRYRTLQGSAEYQYQGPQYIGMSNDGRGCREQQLDLNSSLLLMKMVTLSSSYGQKWADLPVDSTIQWGDFQRLGAGFQTAIPRWPVINYRFSRYLWDYQRAGDPLYSSLQWNNSLDLQYIWRLIMWRLAFQLQDEQNQLTKVNRVWQMWTLSGGQRFGQFSLSLNQRLKRYNGMGQIQWSQGFNFGQRWGRLLNTDLNLDWIQGNAVSGQWKTESFGWAIKSGTDRGQGWNLSLDLSQWLYFYSDRGPAVRNTSWGLKLERNFKNPAELVSLGQVKGRVYEDANGNLVYDNGDKAIEGIPVVIDGKRAGVTGKNGQYRIMGVAAGSHDIRLDVSQLSASMDPSIGGKRRFTTVGVWGPNLDFPLAPLNEVYGMVFQDDNSNGVHDEGEPGLPGVFVLMGENRNFTSSDDEGSYIFSNVPPGKYKVFIDPRFLPDTLAVTGQPEILVEVENQNDVGGISFGVGKKVRPVRKVVFASTQVTAAEPVPAKTKKAVVPKPVTPRATASPEEIKRLYNEGVKQYSTGDYRQALVTWQRLLSLDPGNKEAKKNLERTNAKLEALKKAKGE
jgi:hypothetical protein